MTARKTAGKENWESMDLITEKSRMKITQQNSEERKKPDTL